MGLPSGAAAARRLAGLIVQRQGLVPPVPIHSVLASEAVVTPVSWPDLSVDAVVLGLGRKVPQVFYRPHPNLRRERFTLAHEYGHVSLMWHLGRSSCAPKVGELDLVHYGQEDEADIFASCLLAPDQWLLANLRRHGSDMSNVISSLADANISPIASLLAIKRVLLAGWVFTVGENSVVTAGTRVPRGGPDLLDRTALRDASMDHGQVSLHGQKVSWYRLVPISTMPVEDADVRPTSDLLTEAISRIEADSQQRIKILQRVNGRVGGILREAAGRPAEGLYDALVYRLTADEPELVEQPEFVTWLARKARDVERGTTKKQLRR